MTMVSSSSGSRPARSTASTAPRWRSAAWWTWAGPLTITTRSWPSASRWVTASSPPVLSSTATEQVSSNRAGWSNSTTDTPRRRSPSTASSEFVAGVISTPCTRCSARSSTCLASRVAEPALLHRITA